jgi:ubiquinone/menaquinone biosynthesis C-methylase UbiE
VPEGPSVADREDVELLRRALDRAGYTSAELERRLDLEGPFSLDAHALPVYMRALADGSAFAAVTKLFLLGIPVPREEVEAALAPLDVERLVELGVAQPDDGAVLPSVAILPWSGFLLTSDVLEKDLAPTRGDHVLNVIPPSVTLASLTPRREVGATLDVGVGCGVQSLLASRHSQRVVGVDVNPRALRFAEFNLALNRVDNVEVRLGDAFDAVAGETFDLIVSNPPYVISPDNHYAFRDSGRVGDAFCEDLVRRTPGFLAEGGVAELLVCWAHPPDGDWTQRLREWVDAAGCDTLALHFLSQEPLAYAALWNRHLRWDPLAYDRAIDRWVDHLRDLEIEAIGWGALVLRRRRGRNWFAPYPASMAAIDEAGHHVERLLVAQDVLAEAGDGDDLLALRLRPADDHRLDQTIVLADRRGKVERVALRLEGGFNFEAGLSRNAFQLVSQLDGRPLGDVLEQIAGELDGAAHEELVAEAVSTVRGLFGLGFLVQANGEAPA